MIKDTETDIGPAPRSHSHGRRHLLAGIVILLFMLLLEVTVGRDLLQRDMAATTGASHWSRLRFEVPEPDRGKQLVLYVSNSHAKTGGHVAIHLQQLLDAVQPGRFAVQDLAEPGIFAPDMLQRVLNGMQHDPAVVILSVAYISFSDRMNLALQSHSVRSFFMPGVVEHLDAGFWLRHYDIGLYLDTLLKQHVNIIRYRNQLRDRWEQPLAASFGQVFGGGKILFLDVDERQSWRFPTGFDNNLFDWRLYSGKRAGHLADLAEAVEYVRDRGVHLLGSNLPIHWDKSLRLHNDADYRLYQDQLSTLFADADDYVDYQGVFPTEFTTYDALHPTWHGARLHALDIVLRMLRQGWLQGVGTEQILESYSDMGIAQDGQYRASLSGGFDALSRHSFVRYDLFEPDNARMLMRQLATYPLGSHQESEHLFKLSLRLRYWLEQPFRLPAADPDDPYALAFRAAASSEIEQARLRADYFRNRLVEFQFTRLAAFPLPVLAGLVQSGRRVLAGESGNEIFADEYRLSDGTTAISIRRSDNREIARGLISTPDRPGFLRVDVLGDQTFLLLQGDTDRLRLPTWVTDRVPFVHFGI
jgi:hypothetical protein